MSAPSASRPASSLSSGLVVAGYLCALFVPIVGLILGVVAVKKHNGTGTHHGPWIIAASVASFALSVLILTAGSA
jgi:hypothetical protein